MPRIACNVSECFYEAVYLLHGCVQVNTNADGGMDSGVCHTQGAGYRSAMYPVCKAQEGAMYRVQSSNACGVQGARLRSYLYSKG